MEITTEMEEKLLLSLLRHDKTPTGVECSFFQFGTVGVKFYGYGEDAQDKARDAFFRQSTCYASGLAPKPGRLFAIAIRGAGYDDAPLELHGYTTEVAVMVKNVPHDHYNRMIAQLEENGLPTGDLHYANIGYVVDESLDDFKLVPIDFGCDFVL